MLSKDWAVSLQRLSGMCSHLTLSRRRSQNTGKPPSIYNNVTFRRGGKK